MSDFKERLVAADPVVGRAYNHRDPDAMFTRIVTQYPMPRNRVVGAFKLMMVGAVTFASLITAGGIAVLQSAIPGLPVLALAHANLYKTTSAAPAVVFSSTVRAYEEINFSAGPGLSSKESIGSAYELQLPSNASTEIARVQSIFEHEGAVSPFVSINHESVGVPQWRYSLDSNAIASPTSSITSTLSIEAIAQEYLHQLGYATGAAQISNSVTSINGSAPTSDTDLAYNVVVDGVTTDLEVRFSFNHDNTLVHASGPEFSIGSIFHYPLQSQVAGVEGLNRRRNDYALRRGSTTLTSPSMKQRTSIHVTLTSAITTLHVIVLTNGSVWLVPNYVYRGATGSADGPPSSGTWSTLAINPRYVKTRGAKG